MGPAWRRWRLDTDVMAPTTVLAAAGASLEAQVAELRVQSNNTAVAVSDIQIDMKAQNAKLDILVGAHNQRIGAEAQTSKLGRVIIGVFAVGGPLGAVWAYFHGR